MMLTQLRQILFALLFILVLPKLVRSQEAMFNIQLDNDIFNLVNQTDRYYTNGVYLRLYHPVLNNSLINHILIGGTAFNLQITGLTVHQGIYTPIDIYTNELQSSDRPYASTLLVGQERIVVSSQNQLRIKSSIRIGLIGKSAGGEFVQNFIHGLTPNSENANGWQHQISNDFLIDYSADLEKGWLNTRWVQISTSVYGQVGTYKDLIGMSGRLNVGLLDNQYSTVFGHDLKNKIAFNVFAGARMHYLFFDATLQGGAFGSNNTYTINYSEVIRRKYQTDLGIQLRYKQVMIEGGRVWQNQEFTRGNEHAWGYVKVEFLF